MSGNFKPGHSSPTILASLPAHRKMAPRSNGFSSAFTRNRRAWSTKLTAHLAGGSGFSIWIPVSLTKEAATLAWIMYRTTRSNMVWSRLRNNTPSALRSGLKKMLIWICMKKWSHYHMIVWMCGMIFWKTEALSLECLECWSMTSALHKSAVHVQLECDFRSPKAEVWLQLSKSQQS